MVKKIIIIVLGCCLLTVQAGATTRLEINYSRNMAELSRLKESHPGAVEIYGEIVNISQNAIKLRTCQGIMSLRPDSAIRIFCNGQPAIWQALLPVTEEAYFEARLIVEKDRVLAVDGFYYGEEAVIRGWEYSGGELKVRLSALTGERSGVYSIALNAILPPTERWLEKGQILFVLYGIHGRIRGIFR